MMDKESFLLLTSREIVEILGLRAKVLRVNTLKISQKEFALKAGVSYASYQKFEQKGIISLLDFITIVSYLDRISEIEELLLPPDIYDLGIDAHRKHNNKKRAGLYNKGFKT